MQISVVVAIIHMGTMNAEVGKVSVATAIDHVIAGPNRVRKCAWKLVFYGFPGKGMELAFSSLGVATSN